MALAIHLLLHLQTPLTHCLGLSHLALVLIKIRQVNHTSTHFGISSVRLFCEIKCPLQKRLGLFITSASHINSCHRSQRTGRISPLHRRCRCANNAQGKYNRNAEYDKNTVCAFSIYQRGSCFHHYLTLHPIIAIIDYNIAILY